MNLTEQIERIIRDMWNPADTASMAAEIVSQLPALLYQDGWLPPAETERISRGLHDWSHRAATTLPASPSFQQHPGDVLMSWLTELADLTSGL